MLSEQWATQNDLENRELAQVSPKQTLDHWRRRYEKLLEQGQADECAKLFLELLGDSTIALALQDER